MPPKAKAKAKDNKNEGKGKNKEGKDKGKGKGKDKGKDKGKGKGKGKKGAEEHLTPEQKVEEVRPPKTPPIPLTIQNKPYLEERCKQIVTEKTYLKDTPHLYHEKIAPHLGTPIHRIFQEIEYPHLIQYMRDIGLESSLVLNLKKRDNRTPILGITGLQVKEIDRDVIPSMSGIAAHVIKNNAFVMYTRPGSPAFWAGVRFGDEILDVNDAFVYGWNNDQVHEFFRDQPGDRYEIIVRKRPFTRNFTFTCGKCEEIGFQIHEGRIINVYGATEAYEKGLLVNYQIIEINRENVIGVHDPQMRFAFRKGKQFSITVMPGLIYEHLMDKMNQEKVFGYYYRFNKPV